MTFRYLRGRKICCVAKQRGKYSATIHKVNLIARLSISLSLRRPSCFVWIAQFSLHSQLTRDSELIRLLEIPNSQSEYILKLIIHSLPSSTANPFSSVDRVVSATAHLRVNSRMALP